MRDKDGGQRDQIVRFVFICYSLFGRCYFKSTGIFVLPNIRLHNDATQVAQIVNSFGNLRAIFSKVGRLYI